MNSTLRPLGIFLLCIALLSSAACKQTARSYCKVGYSKFARGDYNGAIADYTHAIALDPDYAIAYYNRGIARCDKGDYDGAIADYNRSIELDPKYAAAYCNRGTAKDAKGDIDGAIADCTRAIELDPNDGWYYNDRGLAKKDKDDFDGAAADFTRAMELDPKFAWPHANRGAVRIQKGDYDGAIADYNRTLELDPKNLTAYFNRGLAKEDKGDPDGAIIDFNHAIQLSPQDARCYASRGYVRQLAGDPEGAIEDCSKAISLDPHYARAYFFRGNVKARARLWAEALADYRLACDVSASYRDYPHLHIWLVRTRKGETEAANKELTEYLVQRLKDDKKATATDWYSKMAGHLLGTVTEPGLFEAAVSHDARKQSGQQCEAWYYAGMKILLSGEKQTAVGYFYNCLATERGTFVEYQMARAELKVLGEKIADDRDAALIGRGSATGINQEPGPARFDLGITKEARDAQKQAVPDVNRNIEFQLQSGDAVKIYPSGSQDPATVYYKTALRKAANGDQEGAIADYTRAIETNPKYAAAYLNRGIAKKAGGDFNGAITDFNHSIDINPKDPRSYENLAVVSFLTRNWPDALANFQFACNVSTSHRDYPHVWIWLIRSRQGDTDAANKELAAFLVQRLRDNQDAASDDWFSKVAGYLLGSITEPDLFAAAASSDAKKDSGQRCEAWFYAGMKKLLAGDKRTAADDFRNCLATRQDAFVEYQMAQAELKALGG